MATLAQAANPTPAQLMQYRPSQPGVTVTTPTDAELAACKVEVVGGGTGASGYVLRDGAGRVVRKFVATKGVKASVDVWSYYLNGEEVYREIDANGNNKPDQFRWFGAGGTRWGVDVNEDGRIDGWRMISPEEVSQEVLKAVITRDVGRLQALLMNDNEIKELGLVQADADKMRQAIAGAAQKFSQTVQALPGLSDKTQWVHLEAQAPQCVPAEQSGAKADYVRYKSAAVLYENGGKHDWLSLGEMVQVGRAWRLVGGPSAGNTGGGDDIAAGGSAFNVPPAVQPLVTKLQDVDKAAPKPGETGAAVVRYNLARAAVLEQILNALGGNDAEQWVKQLADSLSAAAQNSAGGEKAAQIRLAALKDKVVRDVPGTPLAGYVVYRDMQAENLIASQNAKDSQILKVQEAWREALKNFVEKYPQAEDAPDACLQVGMVSEFIGKEVEAKNWYTRLAQNYPQHPLAPKAAGALRRLDLEGQPLQLTGPTLAGSNFNLAQLQGKVVVVYYWASWNAQGTSDFTKLANLIKTYGGKGVELVTVNLDTDPQSAASALRAAQAPGSAHLFQAGGLDSPLAVQYGVTVLPNLFLVGKDGKVVSRTVQMNTLEDEVKKLTEK
jgi:thiol-disulfide isomerase/thioredoxin